MHCSRSIRLQVETWPHVVKMCLFVIGVCFQFNLIEFYLTFLTRSRQLFLAKGLRSCNNLANKRGFRCCQWSRSAGSICSVDSWLFWAAGQPFNPKTKKCGTLEASFFPTCQVRVVRFYVSCLLLSSPPPLLLLLVLVLLVSSCRTSTTIIHVQCSLPDLNHDHPCPVFSAGPQPRSSTPSVRCRTSTDHPRPVFAAGPQPRSSTPSVPCRTSTTIIHAQCSLPDLNHDHPRSRSSTPSVPCRTSTTTIHAQCSLPDLNHDHPRPVFPAGPQPRLSTPSVSCRTVCMNTCQKICQIECQKICQIECQKVCQIECQKICQIECQKICQIDCQKICQSNAR